MRFNTSNVIKLSVRLRTNAKSLAKRLYCNELQISGQIRPASTITFMRFSFLSFLIIYKERGII